LSPVCPRVKFCPTVSKTQRFSFLKKKKKKTKKIIIIIGDNGTLINGEIREEK